MGVGVGGCGWSIGQKEGGSCLLSTGTLRLDPPWKLVEVSVALGQAGQVQHSRLLTNTAIHLEAP